MKVEIGAMTDEMWNDEEKQFKLDWEEFIQNKDLYLENEVSYLFLYYFYLGSSWMYSKNCFKSFRVVYQR